MTTPNTIPADPKFIEVLDRAFGETMKGYNENIETMRDFAIRRETIDADEIALVDGEGKEKDFFEPEYMEFVREGIEEVWAETRTKLQAAKTAKEQAGILYELCRGGFNNAAYTGNVSLEPAFYDAMVNLVSAHYEAEHEKEKNPVTGHVLPYGETRAAYLAGSLDELCRYTDLCKSALMDIEDLTLHYELTHGNAEDPIYTPYGVTYRRYCLAQGLDPEIPGQVPEEEKEQFVRKQAKFYITELFAPFHHVFPPNQLTFEAAWFIGAAISAVRVTNSEDALEESKGTRRILEAHLPKSFVERVQRPAYDTRSAEAILNDPESMKKITEILSEVMDDYPQMFTDIHELVAAKSYMCNMYLGEEPELSQGACR